ncbi:MAG: NAD(P)/FAD-dependent oxidoreductase [Gammaproteobacteria bacterium]|nr:NAD(P)/FAD-dependent oxidoreductase [Gammaproteobacteria bacterium]
MADSGIEHFDVIIVGAGVSGIGAACHLRRQCPDRTFTILEGRDAIGGTWDLFRYPGIRSDSDMHTFGYNFKPWLNPKSIADGPSIRAYVHEAAAEHAIGPHIQFRQRVAGAAWSSADARWTVEVEDAESGTGRSLSCGFLFMCAGYYSYDQPHRPDFPGIEQFQGPVIHPQHWPEGLDYSGKRITVIGSGATAMTLVPAMAEQAAKVTMIQRSPTYVVSRPDRDAIANGLRKVLPERLAYAITRWKNVLMQHYFYHRTRVAPERIKAKLLAQVRKHLGAGYDVDSHFTPSYYPWDERLCLIPNADLFKAINGGRAEVVTDGITGITANGVQLESGRHVDADILVTATGLTLEVLGGVKFEVDGEPVHFPDTLNYKGMMYSGVPNLASVFGYVNASWTLRADLTAEYVCQVLNRMRELGMRQCVPKLREDDGEMGIQPWIVGFAPGYIARAMHRFPKQGDRDPWRNTQNYLQDRKMVRRGTLEDGALTFSNPVPGESEAAVPPSPGESTREAA